MNTGKTTFAQFMDFLPWSTFDRIVARYEGNRGMRKLPCAQHFQVMAFAQSTSRTAAISTTPAAMCCTRRVLSSSAVPTPTEPNLTPRITN